MGKKSNNIEHVKQNHKKYKKKLIKGGTGGISIAKQKKEQQLVQFRQINLLYLELKVQKELHQLLSILEQKVKMFC